jgi:DNA polymerase I-like protein with 3'-5' exonuclease and polymerase domains
MSRIVGFDSETFLLTRSMPAPQSVCWTFDDEVNGNQLLVPWEGDSPYQRLHRELDAGNILVGHNVCYDASIACVEDRSLLPKVFDAFENGQIRCTMVREKLIRIAQGTGRFIVTADDEDEDVTERTRFDLGSTAWRWLRHFVNKKDVWRKRYCELYQKPLTEWPEAALSYALEDARVTRRVYEAQQGYIDYYHKGTLPDEIPQHTYAWALKLVSLWGVRSEREAVERLKTKLTKRQADAIAELLPAGIFRVGGTKKAPKFVKTMTVIRDRVVNAYAELGEPVPLTKGGAVSTATKTLREAGVKDSSLKTLADALGAMKLLSSFIPVLESGTEAPICADYNVLVESGRTSCRNPNMQQLPRGTQAKYAPDGTLLEEAYQPRECFIARPGKAWVSVDYEMAELVGQGQMALDLVGFSVLAEQINAGIKPILAFAAKLASMSYDEAATALDDEEHPRHRLIKKQRQNSKAAMYGLYGGMRAKKLWQSMLAGGADIDLSEARELENAWRNEYPEAPQFFRYVQSQVGHDYGDTGTITQLRSGRIRGGTDYPAACNTHFQGLVADAAKTALKDVVRECYMVPSSPLFGSRPVVFAHDEIIIECDIGRVHDVGYRLAEVMKAAAQRWMPDVKMGADPAAMVRWRKEAAPLFENGKLIPYDA